MKPYEQTVQEALSAHDTDATVGLSTEEHTQRLNLYGQNKMPEAPHPSWAMLFLNQFANPLIYVLLIAAILIFIVGKDKSDAFIITGVVLFNTILGAIQAGKASNILEGLKKLVQVTCVVIRDGERQTVSVTSLVRGDIIILQSGERVSADARVIASDDLHIDESVLTGESGGQRKQVSALVRGTLVADQTNMVFSGTYVMAGSGKAVVVATGTETEFGDIYRTMEDIQTEVPLKKEIERLSYVILLCIAGMCLALFVIGIIMHKPLSDLFIMLAALFVCVIPEGLPVVLTLVLVSGAYRMARQQVLVKNIQAVEAFGRVDVIVIDKTGTLTRNEMMVTRCFADNTVWYITGEGYHVIGDIIRENGSIQHIDVNSALNQLGIASILLNDATITFLPKLQLFDIKGDATEAALYVFGRKLGLTQESCEKEYELLHEIPFDSDLKYHAAFFKHNNNGIIYIIGSPEIIVARCDRYVNEVFSVALDNFLKDGLRVVAIATKKISLELLPQADESAEQKLLLYSLLLENGLNFLGLCGLQDAIRSEVGAIIQQTRAADLQIVMATGDHAVTALHIARSIGLYREGDIVLTGTELNTLSDEQVARDISRITVFARVSPKQKLRIIDIFHKNKMIVAMTGDGVNDAPSLVAADLGIAMGRIGTEVAKQAADIVLLNDSFASITNAIVEGRHVIYTLRRVCLYFFATNLGEILIVSFAMLTSLPLPLSAAHILWLNLVTDGFLDTALSMEKKEGLLYEKTFDRSIRLIDKKMLAIMLYMAVPMALGSFFVFVYHYEKNVMYAQTMTLVTMAMFQWFNAWNCRSERLSIVQLGLLSNKWLVGATILMLLLQCLILYVPVMQHIFKTVPLSLHDWAIVMSVASTIIGVEEIRKFVMRRS